MARSLKKGPFVEVKLYKRIKNVKEEDLHKPIRTYSRSSVIIPDMINKTIHVHNGNKFIPIKITDNLVGHKLGEFSPTRLFKAHGGDKRIK